MGSKFPSNCFVSLPLPAYEYYRLYFALDGKTIFRDMVCEVRSSAEQDSSVSFPGDRRHALACSAHCSSFQA